MKVVYLVIAMFVGTLQQGPDQPDPHANQPPYCINHTGNRVYPQTPETRCECVRMCTPDASEDRNCITYCRRPNCHCDHGCQT